MGNKISRAYAEAKPPAQVGIKTNEALDKFLYMQLEFRSFFHDFVSWGTFLRSENEKNLKKLKCSVTRQINFLQ